MSHTFFTVAIIILFAQGMNAQFYTVTRNSSVEADKVLSEKTWKTSVIDPIETVVDSILMMEEKIPVSIADKQESGNS